MRPGRFLLSALEVVILTGLIMATRCANYREVFVGRDVYFTDADCYARMTRVRMCAAHPGLVVRHHQFENFPQGTMPHTTAPMDYLILGLSVFIQPVAPNAVDLAGAWVSPLLALAGGLFLWWWSRRMKIRYRWSMLILYAISPILVHATQLGRPDHQSLLVALTAVAICAEWQIQVRGGLPQDSPAQASHTDIRDSRISRMIISRLAWALAIWVSAYEPLILLVLVVVTTFLQDRSCLTSKERRAGWIGFVVVLAIAFAVERRLPSMAILGSDQILKNWRSTIGELQSVPMLSSIWFQWVGYMIVIAPVLIWSGWRTRRPNPAPLFVIILLFALCCLTIWQARWGYFFALIFVVALPLLLESIKSKTAVWIAFALSLIPIAGNWDEQLWPNEATMARRLELRRENVELRSLARTLVSVELRPFLAPWWLSPSISLLVGPARGWGELPRKHRGQCRRCQVLSDRR